ncbi:MAG: hypothetical protein QXL10_03215 [Candidatus Bathyarchaeia archaeon]
MKTLWGTIMGNPTLAALFSPIITIAYPIQHWGDVTTALKVWKTLYNGTSWTWNSFFKSIVDAVK